MFAENIVLNMEVGMLELLDMQWAVFYGDGDKLTPDPDRAVMESLKESKTGLALEVKQGSQSFVRAISDKQDVEVLRKHWEKLHGMTLKAADDLLKAGD